MEVASTADRWEAACGLAGRLACGLVGTFTARSSSLQKQSKAIRSNQKQ